jgi:hypothetical protein
MLKKYPHTATITYYSAGTTNSSGVLSVGTLNTIVLADCDIQPAGGRYLVGEGGAVLNYNWDVFSPLFTGSDSVPKDAKLTFFSASHIIVQIMNYQTHVEMKCQD